MCLDKFFGLSKVFWGIILFLIVSTDFVMAKQTYSMGVENFVNFLPYSDYQNKKFSGLGKDILDLYAGQKGYKFDYKPLPLKRRDRMFVKKKLDFIFPDNPKWIADLKKGIKVKYSPMLEYTDGVVVRKNNLGKGVKALKKMGMPNGFTAWLYIDKVNSGEIKVEESSYNGLHLKLLKGRLDGVYVNVRIAQFYWEKIKGHEKNPIQFDPSLPHVSGFWYLSSIKYPEIIDDFGSFMEKNKTQIEKLKKKYNFYQ